MAVYIKGMKMPESCFGCVCACHAYNMTIACSITGKTITAPICEGKRLNDCPLVSVPQHGRLIDADKLRAAFPAPEDWRNVNEALHHVTGIWAAIDAAETVLPAEEGET